MRPLFDTHCHLQDRAFDGYGAAAVERARAAGVAGMLVLGCDDTSNLGALEMAGPGVFPAVGYHPHHARELGPDALAVLAEQAARPEVVAVGEIGLDFYRDLSPRPVQIRALEAQLDLAARLGKPVCLHTRAAESAIRPYAAAYAHRSPLAQVGRPVGVMHCFGGTLEQALDYIDLGFAISLAATVTYPGNAEGRRIAAGAPLEMLVVETDSPYLPPQAMRGKRNEPANVRAVVAAIALARDIPVDDVADATTRNAQRLFVVSVGHEVAA